MGPVFTNRWVPQERGTIVWYNPPFNVLQEGFDTYPTGNLALYSQNTGFNTVGTGVWGVVYRVGYTQGYIHLADAWFFNNFEQMPSGTPLLITGGGTTGSNIGILTGYFYQYDIYFMEAFELYPSGELNVYDSGWFSGSNVTIKTGFVIPSGEIV